METTLMNAAPSQKIAEVRVNKLAVNLAAIPLTLILLGALVVVATSLPHFQPAVYPAPYWVVIGLIGIMVVHEGLHACALILWSRIPIREFRFGVMWKALMPYCHCGRPISVKAYRIYALFPLCVTGAAGLLYLFVFPSFWSAFLSTVVLATCIGDVWVFCKLWRFDKHLLVLDASNEIGCDVFTAPEKE